MKWLPHIHCLQLHPHSEEVVSQISMVLWEEEHVVTPRRSQYIWKSIWITSMWVLSAGPVFLSCQPSHRKRGDNLTPRGHIYSTKPIIPKAQGLCPSQASHQNLVHKENVLTKVRTRLRNCCLKISCGQSLSTSVSHHPQGANESPEVPRLKLKPPRVMHKMDANSSAWPWFTLMDVQHLQGTKTSTGLEIWKGIFFQPGHWKWIRAWAMNSDPKCGQPENTMVGKQAAVFKHIPNITLPPGIKPGCTHRLHTEGSPQQL